MVETSNDANDVDVHRKALSEWYVLGDQDFNCLGDESTHTEHDETFLNDFLISRRLVGRTQPCFAAHMDREWCGIGHIVRNFATTRGKDGRGNYDGGRRGRRLARFGLRILRGLSAACTSSGGGGTTEFIVATTKAYVDWTCMNRTCG
jgi:hypothetical protein